MGTDEQILLRIEAQSREATRQLLEINERMLQMQRASTATADAVNRLNGSLERSATLAQKVAVGTIAVNQGWELTTRVVGLATAVYDKLIRRKERLASQFGKFAAGLERQSRALDVSRQFLQKIERQYAGNEGRLRTFTAVLERTATAMHKAEQPGTRMYEVFRRLGVTLDPTDRSLGRTGRTVVALALGMQRLARTQSTVNETMALFPTLGSRAAGVLDDIARSADNATGRVRGLSDEVLASGRRFNRAQRQLDQAQGRSSRAKAAGYAAIFAPVEELRARLAETRASVLEWWTNLGADMTKATAVVGGGFAASGLAFILGRGGKFALGKITGIAGAIGAAAAAMSDLSNASSPLKGILSALFDIAKWVALTRIVAKLTALAATLFAEGGVLAGGAAVLSGAWIPLIGIATALGIAMVEFGNFGRGAADTVSHAMTGPRGRIIELRKELELLNRELKRTGAGGVKHDAKSFFSQNPNLVGAAELSSADNLAADEAQYRGEIAQAAALADTAPPPVASAATQAAARRTRVSGRGARERAGLLSRRDVSTQKQLAEQVFRIAVDTARKMQSLDVQDAMRQQKVTTRAALGADARLKIQTEFTQKVTAAAATRMNALERIERDHAKLIQRLERESMLGGAAQRLAIAASEDRRLVAQKKLSEHQVLANQKQRINAQYDAQRAALEVQAEAEKTGSDKREIALVRLRDLERKHTVDIVNIDTQMFQQRAAQGDRAAAARLNRVRNDARKEVALQRTGDLELLQARHITELEFQQREVARAEEVYQADRKRITGRIKLAGQETAAVQSLRVSLEDLDRQREVQRATEQQQLGAARTRLRDEREDLARQVAVLNEQAFGTATSARIQGIRNQWDDLRKQLAATGVPDAIASTDAAFKKMIFDAQGGVVYLTDTIKDSVAQMVDAGISGQAKMSDIAGAFLRTVRTAVVRGFVDMIAEKLNFEARLHLNMSTEMPKIGATGAKGFAKPFLSMFKLLGATGSGDISFANGEATFVGGPPTGGGLLSRLFGGGSGSTATTQIAGAVASRPVTDAMGNVVGFQSAASGVGQSAAGASGVAGGTGSPGIMESIGPGLVYSAGVLGTLQVLGSLMSGSGSGAIKGSIPVGLASLAVSGAIPSLTSSLGLAASPALGLAGGVIGGIGIIGGGILNATQGGGATTIQPQVGTATGAVGGALSGAAIGSVYPVVGTAIGAIIGAIIGSIMGSLGNAGPTRGTLIATDLEKKLQEINVPLQKVARIQGHSGVRASGFSGFVTVADQQRAREELGVRVGLVGNAQPFGQAVPDMLERNAGIGVNDLRFGAGLGLGSVIFPDNKSDIVGSTNRLVNNFMALGLSKGESLRQLRKIASAYQVTDFGTGLETIQTRFLQQRGSGRDLKDVNFLKASVKGLADLFRNDFPKGVDVAAIAMRNFTDKAGFDIAKMNKDLDRQVGVLQSFGTGVSGGVGQAITDAFTQNQPNTKKVLRASLRDAVVSGLSSGFTAFMADSDSYKALATAMSDLFDAAISGSGDLSAAIAGFDVASENWMADIEKIIPVIHEVGREYRDLLSQSDIGANAFAASFAALNIESDRQRKAREKDAAAQRLQGGRDHAQRLARIDSLDTAIEQARAFGDEVRASELEMQRYSLQIADSATRQVAEVLSPQQAFIETIQAGLKDAIINAIVGAFAESEAVKQALAPVLDLLNSADIGAMSDSEFSTWLRDQLAPATAQANQNIATIGPRRARIATVVGNSGVLGNIGYQPNIPTPVPVRALDTTELPDIGSTGSTGGISSLSRPSINITVTGNTILNDRDAYDLAEMVGNSTMRRVQLNAPVSH